MHKDHERYCRACEYPGPINLVAAERHLHKYLRALGIKRHIMRLPMGWRLEDHPDLERHIAQILEKAFPQRAARDAMDAMDAMAARAARAAMAARDARDAMAARDAMDARAAMDARDARALHRFACWCLQFEGWSWYWRWELSWVVTTHFGAKTDAVKAWSKPLFEAFVSGAWFLYWTDTTLYWVSKPTVHVERLPQSRRLHNDSGPALESDVENLYFVHGVMVPAFVVVRPDWITAKHIQQETNVEVRRVMIEKMTPEKYLSESGAKPIHSDDFGTLYRTEVPGDEPLTMVKVVNSTPEPSGVFKDYWLRVPPDMKTARAAVAWTFSMEENEYDPLIQT